jgi:hypothetical protein
MILLNEILELKEINNYKLHLARFDNKDQPLDLFVSDSKNWVEWNTWIRGKNEFNRKYIFSVMDFYHETDKWLFGGIWEVTKRHLDKSHQSGGYEIESVKKYDDLVGRLVINLKRPPRGRAFLLENYFDKMSVSEILKERYTGESFSGYQNINHSFMAIESIVRNKKLDWKGALQNVKGIYQIMDQKNGKKYIGSAYGEHGIWSRWECYIGTGHGWNDELTKLIKSQGFDYAQRNFSFTLLEFYPMNTDDKFVRARESFWKEVTLSKKFGYNKN